MFWNPFALYSQAWNYFAEPITDYVPSQGQESIHLSNPNNPAHAGSRYEDSAAFLYYMGIAAVDPKAGGELKAMGAAKWSGYFFLTAAFFYWVDPAHKRTGSGLDETHWYQSSVEPFVEGFKQGWEADNPYWL